MYGELTVALVNSQGKAVVALQLWQARVGFAGWLFSSFISREIFHLMYAIPSQQPGVVMADDCSCMQMAGEPFDRPVK